MRKVRSERVAAIRRRLLRWFAAARRDLPWRFGPGHRDPYRTWISEAMLQQTQVATVIPYYRRFLDRFPTLESLAAATEEEVLAAWSGLGYYSRARALSRAAREAVARHGGLPRTLHALRELPGFGPYTAGAVASIAFGVRTPAVDGNAGRVLARVFLVEDAPHTAAFKNRVWGHAGALVDGRDPGSLNQALIELGALICRPANPRCGACPLEPLCGARRAGKEGALPAVRRRPAKAVLRLAVGICLWRGRVLLVRRPAHGLFAGMWSPPFAERERGQDAATVISKAIRGELSEETGEFSHAGTVVRELTHRRLEMTVLSAPLTRMPRAGERRRLVRTDELEGLAIPTAFRAAFGVGGALPAISGAARRRVTATTRGGGVGSRIERV